MVKIGKRIKKAYASIEKKESYSLEESMAAVKKFPQVKFDETVELHFQLNIDIKSSDQLVRGTVVLPHGTGKKIRIAVFCKGEQALKAKNLGIEIIGAEDLIEKVANGFLDFDCIIATPEIMKDLSKLGRVLGPRGLMPSPKSGTVAVDVEKAIKEVQAGRVEFKSDKQGGIHVGIGKLSFSVDQLVANAKKIIDSVNHAKPVTVKIELIKTLFVSTTMGPGLKVTL